jgi:precorrin-3B synthase
MSPAPEIKGWCPGAYAPMASNDGLLIRAKVIGARIAAAQLAAIAEITRDCGNGLVDFSQRAQLQLRGVTETTLADALARLDAAGLLARDAEAERIANIVASPLAGYGAAAFDANALARELAAALLSDAALRALPAKFLFAIDDGGALPLRDIEADIRIEALDASRVAIRVAGAPDRAAIACLHESVAAALKLARAFVAQRAGAFELRRMKLLVDSVGVDALLREAKLEARPFVCRADPSPQALLGAQQMQSVAFAGVAAPFGRFDAQALATLASLAANDGLGDIRLTPWRAFLIPAETPDAARRITDVAATLGLMTSDHDARLAVAACPGAPECPQAQGETRGALALLAPLAQKLAGGTGVGLHISGCAKGCAHPGETIATLVTRNGRFDLIDNGRASDAPRLRGLALDDVARMLARRAEEQECPTP